MQPEWAGRGWAGRGLWVDINEQEHLLGEQEESTEQCCCSREFSSQQGLGSGTARPIQTQALAGTRLPPAVPLLRRLRREILQVPGEMVLVAPGHHPGVGLDGPEEAEDEEDAADAAAEEADGAEQGAGGRGAGHGLGFSGRQEASPAAGAHLPITPPGKAQRPRHQQHGPRDGQAVAERGGCHPSAEGFRRGEE